MKKIFDNKMKKNNKRDKKKKTKTPETFNKILNKIKLNKKHFDTLKYDKPKSNSPYNKTHKRTTSKISKENLKFKKNNDKLKTNIVSYFKNENKNIDNSKINDKIINHTKEKRNSNKLNKKHYQNKNYSQIYKNDEKQIYLSSDNLNINLNDNDGIGKNIIYKKNILLNKIHFIDNKMDLIKEKIFENINSLNMNYKEILEKIEERFGSIINSILKLKIEIKDNLLFYKEKLFKNITNNQFENNLDEIHNIYNKVLKNKNIEFDKFFNKLNNLEEYTKNINYSNKNLRLEINHDLIKNSISQIYNSIKIKINDDKINDIGFYNENSDYSNEKTIQNYKNRISNKYFISNNSDIINNSPKTFVPSPNLSNNNKIINTKSMNLNNNLISSNIFNKNNEMKNKNIIIDNFYLNNKIENKVLDNNSYKTIIDKKTIIFDDYSLKNPNSESICTNELSASKFISLLDKVNENQNEKSKFYNDLLNSQIIDNKDSNNLNSFSISKSKINNVERISVDKDTKFIKTKPNEIKYIFDHKKYKQNDIILECSNEWTVNQTPELRDKEILKKSRNNTNKIMNKNIIQEENDEISKNFQKKLFN